MQKRSLIIIILLFICILNVFGSDTYPYGLTFNSHQVTQDKRTSLILTPGKPINLAPGFTMEFELKLYSSNYTYGYVFRMVDADSICLDLTSNLQERKVNFILSDIMDVKKNIEFKDTGNAWDKSWIKVRVKVNEDSICCSFDNQTETIPYSLGNLKNIYLSFGRNKYSFFHSTDVPPMSLRNVVIRNEKGTVINRWEMLKNNGNKVYDSVSQTMAVVENGIWEIDRHREWNLLFSMKMEGENSQIATDTLNGRIFIADRDTLYVYHVDNSRMDRIAVEKGDPFRAGGSQLIYDNKHDRLLSYSIQFPQFVQFNFETRRWSDNLKETLPPIQHHNRFIDYENNRLIVFGGYGVHLYHSEIFSHDLDSAGWKTDSLSYIEPRYLSALGYLGNGKALVMGGYGSISGKQEEFPRNYRDLYEIDYRNMTCTKLTEFSNKNLFGVLGNSMVIAPDKSKIWALLNDNDKFQSAINIVQVDMKNYSLSIVSDSIPYNFLDIDSYNDFFYYSKTASLYAVVLNSRIGNENLLNIYSIAYPPLALSDIVQMSRSGSSAISGWIIAAAFLVLCAIAYGFYLFSKKQKNRKMPEADKITAIHEPEKQNPVKNQTSSIFLLGGFRVLDIGGNDITRKFSVLIKNVFLYILLNFIHNKQGITSQKLDEVFWFGLGKNESMNSRNVNMHRIRLLLKEIGNINLLNKNSSWYIEMSNDIFCDYKCVFERLNAGSFDKTVIEQIVRFASEGALLPEVGEEWMDTFKEKYSNSIIEILTNAIRQPDIRSDSKLLLRIADVILLQDDIEEEAIKLKCITLYQMGQKGLSKNCYNNFCESYQRLLKSEPSLKYEDILKGSIL